MAERVRDSIGDLMTDEELAKLVDKAMHEAFFTPNVKLDRYGHQQGPVQAEFVRMVAELVRGQVAAAVSEWVTTHRDDFAKIIDETIAKGMFGLVRQHFEEMVHSPLMGLQQQLYQLAQAR
jgi:hypothetical protein